MDIEKRSESEQAEFFSAVYERALLAEKQTEPQTFVLRIGDVGIRIIFAGRVLGEALLPAMAHLVMPNGSNYDFTLHVWDSTSTGVTMVAPPCNQKHFTDRGDIWGFRSPRFRAAFHWIECSVSVFDREDKEGVWWVNNPGALPYWTKASPLRSLFHWCLETERMQLLHAAAVGTDDGAVLITGKGGVGKSTTALSALIRGYQYASDDYVVVKLDPTPRVYSLYSTAKLNPDQIVRFHQLAPLVSNEKYLGEQKAVIPLFPTFDGQIATCMKLRAILSPRIQGSEKTELAAISSDLLWRAASFTTMSQLPYAGRQTSAFIHEMISSLPGFELALGTDMNDVVATIGGLLKQTDEQLHNLSRRLTVPKDDSVLPLVSVIIPVFNGSQFLSEAIRVVLRQNYPSVEIIVVDDGSTDNIDDVVSSLPVDVRFFKQANAGAASARNRGIKDASGEFIAFLDVDDLWPDRNLTSLVERLLLDPKVEVVHGHGQLMVYDEQIGDYEYVGNPKESFPFYIGAGVYRRSAFEKVGLFDEDLQFAEDTDWFNRAKEKKLEVIRIPEVTLFVRRHSQNMTRGKSLTELNMLRVFKKQLDRKRQTPS